MQIPFFFRHNTSTIIQKLIKIIIGTPVQGVLRKYLQKIRLYNLINNFLNLLEAMRLSTIGNLNIGILNQVNKVIKLVNEPQVIMDCGF